MDFGGREIPLRSVETPVAKRPFEATARDPPRSTIKKHDSELVVGERVVKETQNVPMLAIVPPCSMSSRF